MNVVATNSVKQVEIPMENDKKAEESFSQKKVESEENPLIPPEKEVIKEIEKETPYLSPHPYKTKILYLQRLVEAKVDTQSNRYMEMVEKILINVPLIKVQSKNRILEYHETEKIIYVNRGRLTFEVGDERIKSKPENLILRIEPEPPLHVQKYKPPPRKKKMKSGGYKRWLEKWAWTPNTTEIKVKE